MVQVRVATAVLLDLEHCSGIADAALYRRPIHRAIKSDGQISERLAAIGRVGFELVQYCESAAILVQPERQAIITAASILGRPVQSAIGAFHKPPNRKESVGKAKQHRVAAPIFLETEHSTLANGTATTRCSIQQAVGALNEPGNRIDALSKWTERLDALVICLGLGDSQPTENQNGCDE
jgi:hypothetical protein